MTDSGKYKMNRVILKGGNCSKLKEGVCSERCKVSYLSACLYLGIQPSHTELESNAIHIFYSNHTELLNSIKS